MSKRCPVCSTEYPDATTFCPSDGTPLSGSDNEDRFIGKVLEGKYYIETRIGTGGMGNVYRGRHMQMETNVAIKILHSSLVSDATAVERFRREARAALTVNHPNIIQVMDFGVTDNQTVFIVMELLEGISLQKVLDTEGVVPVEKVVRIFKQVCAAVGTAHAKEIIHRDIKPDNIFVLNYDTPAETVKVLDFSIAKATSKEANAKGNLTEVGLVVGTPQYISPEQAQGLKLDTRADIYSLGVTLYQMLTGQLPFTAASSMALALKHIHALPRPVREINPKLSGGVESVVMKAMAKRPDDRYQTAFELAEDLELSANQPISGNLEEAVSASAPTSRPTMGGPAAPANPAGSGRPTNANMSVVRSQNLASSINTSSPSFGSTTAEIPAGEKTKKGGSPLVYAAIFAVVLIGSLVAGYFYINTTKPTPQETPLVSPWMETMTWIQGASFKMGRDPGKNVEQDESPEHPSSVGDYWLSRYEITNKEYKEFVDSAKYAAPEGWEGNNFPSGKAEFPVTNVTWTDAVEYCKWRSKESKRSFRLPTEAEWEYAARGMDGRIFPWGKDFAPNKTVSKDSDTKGEAVPVKSQVLAADISPFRIIGMAGNVTEWTTTEYNLYPGSKASFDDKSKGNKIVRGGNFNSPTKKLESTVRAWQPPDFKDPRVGFRVAADATPEDRKNMAAAGMVNMN